ncbi:MAG: bifunctional glutamate N-acetyltransferase/amino-acid acetyltransferase ArgJ [Lachnospiraceae bacterium]|nr:bifunctional glutamate N-acetyltransferase/amino-acid acetyltransferase ArgJ [Lachnospiraceae bacterium]
MITDQAYTMIEGGICAAKGIRAGGLNCGLNPDPDKYDLAMFVSDTDCEAAAVYTQNKVKGAPILVTKEHLAKNGGKVRAVIANSKNANTCNADGMEKAEEMCALAADAMGLKTEEIAVASTGVIGETLPIEPIRSHIDALAADLSYDGGGRAEYAIMTTDTVAKEVAVEFTLDGKVCHLGGMAKGSGMIHPNMATTLNFITTDAAISSDLLQKMLSEIVKVTYNCMSVDGDTSTNDMVLVMANGLAGNDRIVSDAGHPGKVEEAPTTGYGIVYKALWLVMVNLTRMLAADGEGAGKFITCTVKGAKDDKSAIAVAKSIISSSLVKCAIFGADANSGRIMCALGYADADVDVSKVDIDLASDAGVMPAYRNGYAESFDEDFAKNLLSCEEIEIRLDLHDGAGEATAWGCDMTYDYVRINGDYRS